MGKSGSEAAFQLQGRIARAFSSNSFVNTMDITAAIEYILTGAQSLGSQDYYRKSQMTILGLAGVLFCKTSRHRSRDIGKMDYHMFRGKYLFGCLGRLGEVLKQQ